LTPDVSHAVLETDAYAPLEHDIQRFAAFSLRRRAAWIQLRAAEAGVRVALTDFSAADAPADDQLALTAFEQYQDQYRDWEQFSQRVGDMSSLSSSAELIVAKDGPEVVGAVAYVGPGKPKADFFQPDWPILRMLVVKPTFRGRGVGRLLTEECIARAVRDRASLIALHTSPIMEVALGMYMRMGFRFERKAPDIHGVRYGVYVKRLGSRP
jgi:ribosomal protein S18 acetylase RimI-like enzyme